MSGCPTATSRSCDGSPAGYAGESLRTVRNRTKPHSTTLLLRPYPRGRPKRRSYVHIGPAAMLDGTTYSEPADEGSAHQMSLSVRWPDADRHNLRWVDEPRRSATGLDSILVWAFEQRASRIGFPDRAPGLGPHPRPQPPGHRPADRRLRVQPGGQPPLWRGRHGTAAGRQGLRHRLCNLAEPLDAACAFA